MDIKSKNIRYLKGTKIAAAIAVWLCAMVTSGCILFLLLNENYISSKNYFDTLAFKSNFARLSHNAVELNVELKSEENIKASGKTESKISDDLAKLHHIQSNLSNMVNFAYYIKNNSTGETVTNVKNADALKLINSQQNYICYDQLGANHGLSLYDNDISDMLSGKPYQFYAAVVEPLKAGDIFYDDFVNFSRIKYTSSFVFPALAVSIILMVSAFIYLCCTAGRHEKNGEIELSYVDSIYTDVHTLLVLIAAVISVMLVAGVNSNSSTVAKIFGAIILSIDIFIGLSYVLSMARQIKCRQIIKNSLLFKAYAALKKFIRLSFHGKVFKAWTLFLLLGYGLINCILFSEAVHSRHTGSGFFILLWLAFNVFSVYLAAKSLISLSQIMEAAKEISKGNLDYALDGSSISAPFSDFAGDILSIQGGLKKAVSEAIKGERMKTDLITNVSHDLKTPLTSIINYVDLLKKEDLKNEKAAGYIEILEEKSSRLKQLIEDLIEASKASSGSLSVNAEKVNLHELVVQACGEYEEKFKAASLDMRIDSPDKNISILADGKHMWRIVENLLSNVVKYSMPCSRVYINIGRNDSFGILTVKNMSALPLNISPEQLAERFVRGDVSRTTEGSGLGLSIAQSLANLQDGRFDISIDGDLFKVTVEIPLWKEDYETN